MVDLVIEGIVLEKDRVSTGVPGIDWLLRGSDDEEGMELRSLYEIYGPPASGKSTLSLHLAGRVKKKGKITLIDLEVAADRQFLTNVLTLADFQGKLRVVRPLNNDGKPIPCEDVCQEAVDSIETEGTDAVIVDSVGMFMSLSEVQGDLTDANMGRRGKGFAGLTRRALYRLMSNEAIVIYVNHEHVRMGGVGYWTPGGDTMKYGAAARLRLLTAQRQLPYGSIASKLFLSKLRDGSLRKDEKAWVVVVPGVGIIADLCVMFEAFESKRVDRKTVVKVDGTSLGRIGTIFKKVLSGDDKICEPFWEVVGWEKSMYPQQL